MIIILVVAVVGLAFGTALGRRFGAAANGGSIGDDAPRAVRTILLPFTGTAISRRSLEAAVRLAKAEDAVIMPAFLARVPRNLPLDAPLPAQCSFGMPMLEAIEQRAIAQGVRVDARVSRGRTYRDALQRLLGAESFDRIIVSATDQPRIGLTERDLQWLLQRVDAEILILRPAPTDQRRISAQEIAGHF